MMQWGNVAEVWARENEEGDDGVGVAGLMGLYIFCGWDGNGYD